MVDVTKIFVASILVTQPQVTELSAKNNINPPAAVPIAANWKKRLRGLRRSDDEVASDMAEM